MQTALRLLDTETLTQPKVLIVEDCLPDTVLIRRLVDSYYPYTIIDHASLRAEACEFLSKNAYDVVFLDLNLPDSTGFEDVKEIKVMAGKTPVIVVTGYYDEAIARNIGSYRIQGIINKADLTQKSFSAILRDAITNIESP